jgi:hypothetical protein
VGPVQARCLLHSPDHAPVQDAVREPTS